MKVELFSLARIRERNLLGNSVTSYDEISLEIHMLT